MQVIIIVYVIKILNDRDIASNHQKRNSLKTYRNYTLRYLILILGNQPWSNEAKRNLRYGDIYDDYVD